MKKAIIFDMDGTLIDTESVYMRADIRAVKDMGAKYDRDMYVHDLAGKTAEEGYMCVAKRFNRPEISEHLYHQADQYFKAIIEEEGYQLKPFAIETLEKLKAKGIKCFIASSTYYDGVLKALKGTNLLPYFTNIISGDQVKSSKPAPDIFLKAAALSGYQKEELLIIEDSISGVKAGITSGIDTIMIPDLVEPDEFIRSNALAILNNLSQILDYL